MKTKKFEEILRRKLESLKPDFQEQDWDKFQSFQQHAAPSFWQTYGHWLGYAVAVLTTATVALLYLNQSRQNDALLQEMRELREQIVAGAPAGQSGAGIDSVEAGSMPRGQFAGGERAVVHSDTVYVIEPRVVYRDRPRYENSTTQPGQTEPSGSVAFESGKNRDEHETKKSENPANNEGNSRKERAIKDLSPAPTEDLFQPGQDSPAIARDINASQSEDRKLRSDETSADPVSVDKTPIPIEAPTQERLVLNDVHPLPAPSLPEVGKAAYRRLVNRIPRAARKRDAPVVAKSEKISESRAAQPKPVVAESAEKITKEESLLPEFGLNLPFRVGAGQQWEGHTRAFSLWNEVLFGDHWAVQAGVSWQKLEDQKFFDVKIFDQKMRTDFRRDHADKLPPSFDIFNISTSTRVVRIPLNLTYRNEIGRDLSYFIGAGTNVNLKARQTLSFDFKRPSKDYGQESKERTIAFPLINNVNALVGVEKRWSPIVLQLSSFLTTRFKTFPFLDNRTDVGLQVKVLYEFRADKKK
ncbi:hypothetical protein [Persicitalea jodogahamensis]|uniref:Outer membrane protein beta-barrel domain-containing protein n=1 Tax=Persicitalea jodogahamensis TaxID=402147 RepID=A0A8J3D6F8_9BACT|nr:hypothetical protein [Persicitalea jodogahamensis]GHB56898.1 hypothetical protein GCM10007390_07880 [Persicitalea jodogahamensis]